MLWLRWTFALILTAGCTADEPGEPRASESLGPSQTAQLSVEQRFEQRRVLPDCGTLAEGHGGRATARDPQVRCLLAAASAGAEAELLVVTPTVEGDPIRAYYRVRDNHRLEMYIDSTADSFGGSNPGWTYQGSRCEEPRGALVKLVCRAMTTVIE